MILCISHVVCQQFSNYVKSGNLIIYRYSDPLLAPVGTVNTFYRLGGNESNAVKLNFPVIKC